MYIITCLLYCLSSFTRGECFSINVYRHLASKLKFTITIVSLLPWKLLLHQSVRVFRRLSCLSGRQGRRIQENLSLLSVLTVGNHHLVTKCGIRCVCLLPSAGYMCNSFFMEKHPVICFMRGQSVMFTLYVMSNLRHQ